MANPNIVNTTQIYGKTSTTVVSSDVTNVVTNNFGSNKIIKINSLVVTNTSSNPYPVFSSVFDGSDSVFIAYNITVPNEASIVLSSKDTSFYLEEGFSLDIYSTEDGVLDCVCSFEEIF